MADIRLAKPAAGASESVQCAPDARFVFDFPTSDATLARDGDNLNISFQDGSRLQLEGFYQEYNGDNLPSFSIDGTEVAAADFFEAMNEPDLMPAAGPTTGTVANGARFHEWGDSALTGGIEHLNGLDWGFARAFEWDDVPNAVGYHNDGWDGGTPDNPVTLVPEDPTPVPPGTPDIPGVPGVPTGGEPGNAGIVPPGDVRLVSEAGLRDGDSVSVNGAMRITAPDGLASIEIGGRVIWQDGQMLGNPEFHTDEGYFHNFAYDAATGRLTYTYTLTEATQEHGQPGQDHIAHTLPLTVRDVDGDAASNSITIIIRDDVPEIAKPVHDAGDDAVREHDTGNVVENAVKDTAETITLDLKGLTLGADDGDGQSVPQALTVEVAGHTFTFAATTDADGNYSFEKQTGPDGSAMEITGNRADGYRLVYTRPESDVQAADTDARSDTYTFNITVKDADGDIATTSQTIKTDGTPDVGRVPGGPEPTGPVLDVSEVTVDEAGLPFGTAEDSSPATATGAFTVSTHGEGGVLVLSFTAADGTVREITIDLDTDDNGTVRGEATISTAYGDLTVTGVTGGTVTYTYTLNSEYRHPAPGEGDGAVRNTFDDAETVKITLTDNIGHDVKEGTLGVNIVDDIPEIATPELVAGEYAVREQDTGNVVENAVQDTAGTITLDLKGLTLGADDGDGQSMPEALSVEVGGHTFTFAVTTDADGNYSFSFAGEQPFPDGSAMEITGNRADGYHLVYTRPAAHVQQGNAEGQSDEYTFDITVKDADGDIATTSQTVKTNVTPDVGRVPGPEPSEPGLDVSEVTVDEAGLTLGSANAADPSPATATGSFTVSTHGEGGTLVLSFPAAEEGAAPQTITINLDEHDSWTAQVDTVIRTEYGTLTVTKVENGLVEYTYTLTGRYGHEDPADGVEKDTNTAERVEHIDVTLTDNVGHDVKTGTLGVNIVDDVPDLEKIAFDNDRMENQVEDDNTYYISDSAATISGQLSGLSLGADADGGTVTLEVLVKDKDNDEVVLGKYDKTFDVKVVDGKVTLIGKEGDSPISLELDADGRFIFNFARPDGVDDKVNETYTFTATVVDSDGDTVTTQAEVVTNHDPGFIPTTPPDGNEEPDAPVVEITVHESMLDDPNKGSEHGDEPSTTQSGTFGITTHGEGGTLTLEWGGEKMEFKLSADDTWNGETQSISTRYGTFEITGISNGTVEYTFTLKTALEDTGTDPEDLWNSVTKDPIKMTLTDGVNQDVAKGNITVTVVDDAPVFTPESANPDDPEVTREPLDHLHFDFTTMTENSIDLGKGTTVYRYGKVVDTNQDDSPWFIVSSSNADRAAGYITAQDGNFALTATFVHYQYTQEADGTLTVRNIVDLNNGIYNSGKSLSFTGEGGLSVGGGSATTANYFTGAWNDGGKAGEISVGDGTLTMTQGGTISWGGGTSVPDKRYKLVNQYGGEDSDYNTISGANVSEAVVFDLRGDVAFGFNAALNNVGPGDRVLLTFMMTPKNSDDDIIVKMVEYDPENRYIPVEDGFSKVIISSVPKGDKYDLSPDGLWATSKDAGQENGSGFTIAVVDFYKALYEAHGTVEAHSADGVTSYSWDWSDIRDQMVHVNGTNSGDYRVTVDEKTGKATLSGEGNLNGKELFTATINNDGEWSVSLKYEFTLESGDPFKILAHEGDNGDAASQVIKLDPKFNRFSEMLAGHSTDKTDIAKDLSDDRIGGQDGNSLIFGKGGDDILLGDKLHGSYDENLEDTAVKDILDELLTVETGQSFGKDTTKDGKDDPGNDGFIQKVSQLDYAQKHELGEQLEKLENAVDGGDDAIYGGLGNDFIFAGAGNDVIVGHGQKNPWVDKDADIIYAGSGNDIIFYNEGAYINGGSDVDLLLGTKGMPSLKDLVEKGKVDNVEVLIKTKLDSLNSLNITSHAALLTYGVVLGENAVRLDRAMWEYDEETGTWLGKGDAEGLTLESIAPDGTYYGVFFMDEEVVPRGGQDNDAVDTQGLDAFAPEASLYGAEDTFASSSDEAALGDDAPLLFAAAAGAAATSRDAAGAGAGEEEQSKGQTILGTDTDEVLMGTDGDDFIDGGAGSDTIYAGAGDDLIVYDATDYLIDGGEGIDFLLAGDAHASLGKLLNEGNGENGMPIVNNVEVLLKGVDTTSLTSMDKLAEKFGLRLEKGEDGQDRLVVDTDQWTRGDTTDGVTTWTNNADSGITMETTLQQTSEAEGQAVLTAKVAAETGGNN
ncbi:MAG: hypothetical protein HDQ90_00140 [Desulfovibrio sp.]|nr:hypothetical protein [Desulfovibrio sp.]